MTNNKMQQIQQLNDRYKTFFPSRDYVFGSGNYDCKMMLIGEAPGKDEIIQGKPFVGSAGKILTNLLSSISVDRHDVYITNAMKYRLSEPGKRPDTLRNRPATQTEIADNAPFLKDEIIIIKPKIIVTLGNVPLTCILGKNAKIGYCHGEATCVILANTPQMIYPLYHPASLIYNRSLESVYDNDIKVLQTIIKKL